MLVSDDIPNLVNGVSQQPPTLRLPTQSETQENCISSVHDGMTRRPATRHLARITTANWGATFTHSINRDSSERYLLIVTTGAIRVFDLMTYTFRTVNTPDGISYLTDRSKGLAAVSIADYTVIVNKAISAAMTSDNSPEAKSEHLITINGLAYNTNYRVRINGTERAAYLTPQPNDDDEARMAGAEYVANELRGQLVTSLGSGWSVDRNGAILRIRKIDGADFTTRVDDHTGGSLVTITTNKTQNFAKLPGIGFDGFRTEIIGSDGSGQGNYYVQFTASGADGVGVWQETLRPNIKYKLDAATMPHVLVRESDGTFTFRRGTWDDRLVGDNRSVPIPSMIGRPIRDIFFLRNRLGFLADENVVMSRAGEYFSLWPETATQQLDSDPIDIGGTHTKVSLLNWAVPYDKRLIAFSDQTQFVLDGGDLLTPKTVSFLPATEFDNSPLARPVSTGTSIIFATPRGAWTGVQEYYLRDDIGQNDADDTTSHCQKYIPGNVFSLSASTTENIVVALSRDDPTAAYVYTYYAEAERKLQSSWSRWRFVCERILSAEIFGTSLFLLLQRSDGVYLEEIPIESGAVDTGSKMLYRVDRKVYETSLTGGVYADGWTTFTLPYPSNVNVPLWAFIRAGDSALPEGYVIAHERPSATTIRLKGNHLTSKLCIGVRYSSEYEFSQVFIRKQTQSGSVTQNKGRLQVLNMSLEYANTGFFDVHVYPTGRGDPLVTTFSGYVLGVTVPGSAAQLHTGSVKVSVSGRNTEARVVINSDHFTPFHFTSASWDGRYSPKARSI